MYNTIAQVRVLLSSSCNSGSFGGVNNNHLFTRGGGLVLAVGGTGDNGSGDFLINYDIPVHAAFRTLIAAGESYGGAALQQYAFHGLQNDRTVFYGDLSIGAMASPANGMPVVMSLAADKTTIQPGETVNFSMTYSDPDAGSSDSPYVDYEHQLEWFPEGYDYGRSEPGTVTHFNSESGGMSLSHTYNTAGKYVMRVEVTDEWQARAWKEVTITVQSWPVAVGDSAAVSVNQSVAVDVMNNDYDSGGLPLMLMYYSQPGHGVVTKSGTTLTYTPATNWVGTDSFTYEIWNSLFYKATGTVTVTVYNELADTNADGIADVWAEYYFPGSLPSAEASNDPDGDGVSNLMEYIAGSDPTNRNGVFLLTITVANGLPTVSFSAKASTVNFYGPRQRHYALEYSTDITGGSWAVVPGYGDITAAGQTVTFDSNTATKMFFRARAWLE